MPNVATALWRPWQVLVTVAAQANLITRRIALALEVRAERRRLQSLDQRALKDMGFNKGQADCEASRSFWDLPVDRLRL
jgi:uncharacterized protein YjiS (DUF1127 family)